ncbi:MAG: amidohydrolase family protein, partial [Magnetospirillum sp.]|nr:amidohydrolase family protein [Magnetospirillum sp.]
AAAFAVGREAEVGTLETGKRADISAFSADFMTCAPADILKAQPVLTMVDGSIVHQA